MCACATDLPSAWSRSTALRRARRRCSPSPRSAGRRRTVRRPPGPGCHWRCPRSCRGAAGHPLVVVGVVATVPGRRASRGRRSGAPAPACRGRPTAARASPGRDRTGGIPRVAAVGIEMSGSSSRTGTRRAPRRWRDRDESVGRYMTGVMYLSAMRDASIARVKQSAGVAGASTATGDSPCAPYRAWNRSACSVLVGRPVDGPARWTLTMTTGSSVMTARPIASVLSANARTGGAGRPSAPPKAAPMAAPMAAISSSAWKVRTPNACGRQVLEDVRGRGDRIGAVEEVALAHGGRGQEAEGRGLVAGDVPVRARGQLRLGHAVGLVEHLRGLAERVPGLQGAAVGFGDDRPATELLVDPLDGRGHRALVEPEHQAQGEEVLREVDLLAGHLRGPRALQR